MAQTQTPASTPFKAPPLHISIDVAGNHMETAGALRTHADQLRHLADLLDPSWAKAQVYSASTPEERSEIHTSELKAAKKTRKAAKVEVPEPDEAETDLGFEAEAPETDEAPAEEQEPEAEEAPAPVKKTQAKKPALTLEANIIPAFQAFSKKYSREKAGQVLGKFKVKSVRDLPEAQYPEVLKALGV